MLRWGGEEEEREIYKHLDVKQWQISWPTTSVVSLLSINIPPGCCFYTSSHSSHTFLIPPGPGIFVVSRNILKLILPIKLSEDSSVCDFFFQSNFTNRLQVFYVLRGEEWQRVVKHVMEITWTNHWLTGPAQWGWGPVPSGLLFWMTLIIFYLSSHQNIFYVHYTFTSAAAWSTLIGWILIIHSDATPALLCHKDIAQGTQSLRCTERI